MQTLNKKTVTFLLLFIILSILAPSSIFSHRYPEDSVTSIEYDPTKDKAFAFPDGTGKTPRGAHDHRYTSSYLNLKDRLHFMMKSNMSIAVVVLGLLLAFFVGALHALTPGHGKTIVAAYLVGSKGTLWHAVFLGIVVTIAHTFSVVVLGLIVLFSSNYIVPERIYPWLSIFSAMLVTGMGIWLFLRSYRNLVLAPYLGNDVLLHHGHSHDEEHHHGEHEEGHHHPHPHEHDDKHHEEDKKMRTRDLFTLGIAGGIIPCPDAIVILLIGVALNRIIYGLVIILAFGMGLATVLITIGILVVSARSVIQKFTGKNKLILYQLPILSSIIIIVIGIMLGIQTFFSTGIISNP